MELKDGSLTVARTRNINVESFMELKVVEILSGIPSGYMSRILHGVESILLLDYNAICSGRILHGVERYLRSNSKLGYQ
ncbi:hypothetical protein Mcup_1090 [Metallosphaera cuprina Ar-4]|uniref:Uncharacterized protein n=1 Tax=Metallosphaera cuprina (strain Ar-4) TaxID=1006006 RepID=F4G2Z7_METCR|nr:hypothetical protein Mcup_1090 [Metallosphaera cuprina Ar-4]